MATTQPETFAAVLAAGTKLDLTRRSLYRNNNAADRDSVKTISEVTHYDDCVMVSFKGSSKALRGLIREDGTVGTLTGEGIRYTVNGLAQ